MATPKKKNTGTTTNQTNMAGTPLWAWILSALIILLIVLAAMILGSLINQQPVAQPVIVVDRQETPVVVVDKQETPVVVVDKQETPVVVDTGRCDCCDYSTAKSYGYHGEFDPLKLHKPKGWITPSYALFKSDSDGEKGLDYATWLAPNTRLSERGIVYFFRCTDDPDIIFNQEKIYWKKIFSTTGELLFEQ